MLETYEVISLFCFAIGSLAWLYAAIELRKKRARKCYVVWAWKQYADALAKRKQRVRMSQLIIWKKMFIK